MMKTKTTQTALFVALLLASACDAGPAASGRELGSEAGKSDDREIDDSLSGDDEGVPVATEDEDVAAQSGNEAPAIAGAREPASSVSGDSAAAAKPAAAAIANDAPAPTLFMVRGSTSSGVAADKATKAALSAGAKVSLSLLSDAGALELVADGKVDLHGKFNLALPVDVRIDLGVAQLLDATGKVLGSVLVGGAKGSAGGVLDLAPISIESSLEVDVLLAALKCPCPPDKKPSAAALALDVSALIDANLSNALHAALKLGVDADVVIDGLATALSAAGKARLEVLADLGVKLDANILLDAQLDALSELGQGLLQVVSGKAKLPEVNAKLALGLDGALSLAGRLESDLRARAQIAASLAFTSSLAGSFKADAKLNAALSAAVHACAALDAEITANAVVELLSKSGASDATIKVALDAGLNLKADVALAVDLKGIVAARKAFIEAVCGKPQQNGGLIGGILGDATGLVGGVLDGLLGALPGLSLDLDAKLSLDLGEVAKVDACVSADASLSLDASLSVLVDTLAKFDADVRASAKVGVNASASAKAAAKVLVTAELFGRAAI